MSDDYDPPPEVVLDSLTQMSGNMASSFAIMAASLEELKADTKGPDHLEILEKFQGHVELVTQFCVDVAAVTASVAKALRQGIVGAEDKNQGHG